MTHKPDPINEADAPDDLEVVDGLPVLATDEAEPGAALAHAEETALVPARHAAALAATTFVAGAATVAVISRRRSRAVPRRGRKKKGRTAVGEVLTSNSFLVDVHLLRRD